MASKPFYPPLTLVAANAVEEIVTQYSEHGKDYLKDSPYSAEIRFKLEVILTTIFAKPRDKTSNPSSETKDLTSEVEEIYANLKDFKTDAPLAPNEQIQLLKLQTTLLERLLEARERAVGVDQFVTFREVVLDFVSSTFDADQINDFKARLALI